MGQRFLPRSKGRVGTGSRYFAKARAQVRATVPYRAKKLPRSFTSGIPFTYSPGSSGASFPVGIRSHRVRDSTHRDRNQRESKKYLKNAPPAFSVPFVPVQCQEIGAMGTPLKMAEARFS